MRIWDLPLHWKHRLCCGGSKDSYHVSYLDSERVSALLGDAPVVNCPGRTYPVETIYVPTTGNLPLEKTAAAAVRHALAEQPGDILVFYRGKRNTQNSK